MLDAVTKSAIDTYAADAKSKLDALPARVVAEAQLAADEQRQPYPIVPLVEVQPAAMKAFLEHVGTGKIPDAIAETYGTILRVSRKQQQPFAMRADQLVDLLNLGKSSKPE
jgi:hypothetical protein